MSMSAEARQKMLLTEKVVLRYYNDMGKKGGNCTWGAGFYAHKGVCSEEEMRKKVDASSVDVEFAKRLVEAERHVKRKIRVPLNQAQFDALVSYTYNTTHRAQVLVYAAVNQGDFPSAAGHISQAVKVVIGSGKSRKLVVAPGLFRRRAEESAPFRDAR
jgi:GH24 family phage-related lysozyme (muramidase)